jgi:predicted deacetylase
MEGRMELTIAIDDVHPEIGWGMPGDECMEYLKALNEEFGAKFTLFIPSNYHHQYPLSEHKEWVNWLKSISYFELAAHGHYHECERDNIGECEFFELDTPEKAQSRIKLMLDEWEKVDHKPAGWRNPGWLAHPAAIQELGNHFEYAAVHYQHNHNLPWKCKTIFGHDGIHETDITLHNGCVMFQSHIAGNWNDNVWNETNYNQIRLSLNHLTNIGATPKTLLELN